MNHPYIFTHTLDFFLFMRHFLRMTPTEQIITALHVYCSYRNLSERYVSDIIFSSSTAVLRLKKNSGITLRSFEKAMTWLATNWPPDLPWPEGVPKYLAAKPFITTKKAQEAENGLS